MRKLGERKNVNPLTREAKKKTKKTLTHSHEKQKRKQGQRNNIRSKFLSDNNQNPKYHFLFVPD